MRKIAAHYWLRPDGSIGKFPIVTFNEDNQIAEIRERDTFREEASLELVNGFLVPGLIEFYSFPASVKQPSQIKKYLNRLIISGVQVLGVPNDIYKNVNGLSSGNLKVFKLEQFKFPVEDWVGFEKIQNANDSIQQLKKLTIGYAKVLGIDNRYGSIEVGKKPGILAISNLSYETFNINHKSKLKIII
ncbi:hypothetical protein [Saccharicrinis sp. GN24d3]|uniref:hypothetical protein n=1 Tax=Saccharicrinis sp. GN24d3 TaxID=3458416 RepID=UPI0040373FDA